MTKAVKDFFPGTTKRVKVTCKLDGVLQDITGDVVTMRLKKNKTDTDDEADMVVIADVATLGATGIAQITGSDTDTAIAARRYFVDIVWRTAGGDEHVVYSDVVTVKSRSSDV